MATQYSEVYSFFLSKISDYSFLSMTEQDRNELLEDYLRVAIAKFKRCKKDLSDRDNTNKVFNKDLSDEEIDILSKLMVVEYLKPSILDAKHKKLMLTDKEFRMYSQANHIEAISKLYRMFKEEADKDVSDYTFNSLGKIDGTNT